MLLLGFPCFNFHRDWFFGCFNDQVYFMPCFVLPEKNILPFTPVKPGFYKLINNRVVLPLCLGPVSVSTGNLCLNDSILLARVLGIIQQKYALLDKYAI